MSEMRTIEIDFEVHKRIELERTSFNEPPNTALRRLLGIEGAAPAAPPQTAAPSGRPWAGKGVTLPHGTELRMEYNGRVYTGRIENGRWLVEGKEFKSPSAAAGGVALTKDGRHTSLDGWIYWHVKRPGDAGWTAIRTLRSH
ncbi:hypothetical protein NYR54_00975 [Chelativorans sp. SCAU2101]|uniref:RAMA domain-containing protein n=1 Tax=Chelativorans petroleitrophicus TaxID=2975484 RepID=A0A9X2X539_9HYPH|nr:hypothetical protein [Chelativorans petroleitrophicus]MCT8988870.1 hypothetical protein [Chelativorans petroleitrophicus]